MAISRPKILSIALIVSLVVNVIVGSFIAVQWFGHGAGQARAGGPLFNHRAAMSILEKDPQENVRKIWKARREILRPYFKEYGQSRRQLAQLLGAEKLDEDAINLAYGDMLAKRLQIEEMLKVSLLEFANALPADQRAMFFNEGFRKHKKHKRPGKDKSN
ncbi:periplasmic heavy metal sensor [Sneathiella marina]|uniref:Periplasmic heavy metal sensor n=1 Tax=Sneathiella marina TaxID=2950108 RepID=A0ABY4W503_9PROT|nr:periplasmic heavy metal sensor [Sneathiella marina]USG60977.1 periplasmic heavy metal sensor [Sneathiella marina]